MRTVQSFLREMFREGANLADDYPITAAVFFVAIPVLLVIF